MSKIGYSQPFKMVGKVAPVNKNQSKSSIMMHVAGHDGPPDGQVEIITGTNKVDRSLRKEISNQLAEAVAQGANVQGYTKDGSGKLELFSGGDIVDYKNTRGGTRGNVTGLSDQPNTNVNVNKLARQINRGLRRKGSVSVENGVVTEGVTITRPMTEKEIEIAAKQEAWKQERLDAQAEKDAKKAELWAKINAERDANRANREKEKADKDAKRLELQAQRNAQIEAFRAKRDQEEAERNAKRQAYYQGRRN